MAELRCEDCGFEFEADMGEEDAQFEVYRCDECDRVLRAERTDGMEDVLSVPCGCGGRYCRGRPPKCPDCRSPNVVRVQIVFC
jgi:rubredoxin